METEKNSRMLELFFRVLRGETISVKAVAAEYGVSTKSIGRGHWKNTGISGGTPRPDAAGGTGVFL